MTKGASGAPFRIVGVCKNPQTAWPSSRLITVSTMARSTMCPITGSTAQNSSHCYGSTKRIMVSFSRRKVKL